MRPSRRDLILDAAFEVIGKDGVAAVTFEAVADAAGVTKGGLVYHFPSKDDLLLALHEHQAAKWEAALIDALTTDPESATADDRLAAYARVAIRRATGADLLLMLEASVHPELRQPWNDVAARWLPDLSTLDADDPDALTRVLAVLAADGLWISDSIGELRLPDHLRSTLAARIADMIGGTVR